MFCPQCGTELPDDADFCHRCGRIQRVDANHVRKQQKRRAWGRGIIAALVIVILLACVVPLVWIVPVFDDGDGDSPNRPGISTPPPIVQQTPTP